MTVTVASLAVALKVPANDPQLVRAHAAAMSWARTELGREDDDDLSDLRTFNEGAIEGYARDWLKLPQAQFGYFEGGGADAQAIVAIGDIGRRHRSMLGYGLRTSFGFA